MRNLISAALLLLLPTILYSAGNDFAFISFGLTNSQTENWGSGFNGHVEAGSGGWGLRVFYTRCQLDQYLKTKLLDKGTKEFSSHSTLFGIMLVKKILVFDTGRLFFTDFNLGIGPGFYNKKLEIDDEFSEYPKTLGIEPTPVGVTGLSFLLGIDIGIGPAALSPSYYLFKGFYKGEQFVQRVAINIGFIL